MTESSEERWRAALWHESEGKGCFEVYAVTKPAVKHESTPIFYARDLKELEAALSAATQECDNWKRRAEATDEMAQTMAEERNAATTEIISLKQDLRDAELLYEGVKTQLSAEEGER